MYKNGQRPNKKLLVVDDQRESALEVADYFSLRGFQVHTAVSAHEALSIVLQEPMDLVLIKSHLPGLNGYEVAPMLKKIRPGIRVMFMVEETQEEVNQKREETLFFECFSTPLDLDKVWKAMKI